MTAAPLFASVLPPATSPARPTPGEAASDGPGLFAVLLAGTQPLQMYVAPGADPAAGPVPALAPPPAGDGARPSAAPTPAMPLPEQPATGTVGAQASGTAPAALPPTLPLPIPPGRGQGSPLAQLEPASPDPEPPLPSFAQSADRTRTPPAPHPARADPSSGRTQAAEATAAPLPPAARPATQATVPAFGPVQTTSAPPAPPEMVPSLLAAHAQVALPPHGWSLQISAPRAATDTPLTRPHAPASASTGDRSIAAAEVRRSPSAMLPPTSGAPGPATGQPAPEEQAWLGPSTDAPEGAVARSEQAATESTRVSTAGRSAPPPPMVQVGIQIARAAPARIDRLFVQLEPASLGRVEVRLEFHRDHQVSAVIAAERPDTLDALQRDARVLERGLQQAGLRLDSDGLTFSLKREQAHEHPRQEGRLAPPADDLGEQPLLGVHRHEPAPVQWFRAMRALDIRV